MVRSYPVGVDGEVNPLYTTNANANNTGAAGAFGSSSALALMVDMPIYQDTYPMKAQLFRADQNPQGVLKNSNTIYPWYPYSEQPATMVNAASWTSTQIATSSAGAPIFSMLTQDVAANNVGFNVWSDNFSATEISSSTALGTGVSFRLEVRAIWEYLVQPTSAVAALTVAAPKANTTVINQVNESIKNAPVAVSSQQRIASVGRRDIR
jgi:hypothetical protein